MDPMFIDVGKFSYRDLNTLKQNMTLDLFSMEANQAKLADNPSPALLSSPDLMMLKVVSPEMEKMFIDQQIMVNSPSVYFSRNPTEEHDSYASGFVGTLQELHSSGYPNFDQQDTASSYESLDSRFPAMDNFRISPDERLVIKDEPHTVPDINSPPMSPIDMESQERIKLERKRLNNRLAAAKCRKRKLERIGLLEEKVKILKGENAELTQVVNRLMDQVYHLKQQVIEHAKSGCPISLALTND